MSRFSKSLRAATFAAFAVGIVAPAFAQSRRPTPREAIERNLEPVSAALRELSPTDAERATLADVIRAVCGCDADVLDGPAPTDACAPLWCGPWAGAVRCDGTCKAVLSR